MIEWRCAAAAVVALFETILVDEIEHNHAILL